MGIQTIEHDSLENFSFRAYLKLGLHSQLFTLLCFMYCEFVNVLIECFNRCFFFITAFDAFAREVTLRFLLPSKIYFQHEIHGIYTLLKGG